jgi:hypothetical protein
MQGLVLATPKSPDGKIVVGLRFQLWAEATLCEPPCSSHCDSAPAMRPLRRSLTSLGLPTSWVAIRVILRLAGVPERGERKGAQVVDSIRSD